VITAFSWIAIAMQNWIQDKYMYYLLTILLQHFLSVLKSLWVL